MADSRLLVAALVVVGTVNAGLLHRPARSVPEGQPQPIFSAQSELVVLHVMVKDRKGAYVTDLTRDRFSVYEDGARQAIEVFDRLDAPVTVGLIVDSSGSMSASRDRLVAAVTSFATNSNPEDEMFALTFNDTVHAALAPAAPFTSDAVTLRSAITGALVTWGRTALYDALSEGLAYVSRGQYPVKVLVVVSDGGDNASRATYEDVLRATQVSNTAVYTIAMADRNERDARPKRLKHLAEVSGGEAFHPRSIGGVEDALGRIARDIRNTYTIGYAPTDTTRDGRFRRVEVRVSPASGRALRVRTRQGYAFEEK